MAVIRLELMTPKADVVSDEAYNRLFTLHGVVMVWFFLIPSIPTIFGNFLIPLMIGAKDLAFPRLNLISWYLNLIGGLFVLYVLISGGVDTGWTFYTPYSTMFANGAVIPAAAGVFFAGFSSIATGINFIATIHMLRTKGMTWFRLPLFVWAMYAVSLVFILATPVLAITLVLISAERYFGLPIFDPAKGGDPLLFQHLFWFYSHPAVYIMILPAMGVVSEVITCFARRKVFGYTFMVYALVAIAAISFFVCGHHMFVSGMSPYAGLVFSLLSFVVAVPSAIKVFNWTGTLFRGQITFEAPMLYALGFLGLFTVGGLTGLSGFHPHRCARPRHLLRDRTFPLHHGGRIGVGALRRAAFLVTENHGQDVPGIVGAFCSHHDVLRLQFHVLPAVHPGLSRHAAALSRVPARVSGVARDVVHGRERSGGGLSPADPLPDLVAVHAPERAEQSVECDRAGVADDLSATARKFRKAAGRQ